MKIKYILYLLLLIYVSVGCSQNEMIEYENDPAIYFAKDQYGQRDSINHTFFILNVNKMIDTVLVKIYTMGEPAPYDRPVHFVQTNMEKLDAAIPNVHYIAFDNPDIQKKMVVPADSVVAYIPIVLFRETIQDTEAVKIEFSIAQNDYFRPGINSLRNFTVTSTANAVKPAKWDSNWRYYFGKTWGTVKMRFIIDATGYTDWDTMPDDREYINYMAAITIQKFKEYNRDNPDNPLKEVNGDLVNFEK